MLQYDSSKTHMLAQTFCPIEQNFGGQQVQGAKLGEADWGEINASSNKKEVRKGEEEPEMPRGGWGERICAGSS